MPPTTDPTTDPTDPTPTEPPTPSPATHPAVPGAPDGSSKPRGLICMEPIKLDEVYGPQNLAEVHRRIDPISPPISGDELERRPDLLREIEVIFASWGMPRLTEELLDQMPKLRAVFYAAGSIRNFMTDATWDRGVRVTSAFAMNAIPVAEFTVSQIIFALKLGWQYQIQKNRDRRWTRFDEGPGAYGSTVGLVSLGAIGRLVVERLQTYDVKIIAHDPFIDAEEAAELGVELVAMDTLFERADAVSLHTPWLPSTVGLIKPEHLRRLKPNATLINTSRGAIIDEPGMIAVLHERPDLVAVLDVTYPEPPADDSDLWTLPNAILTPHIAGSMYHECRRMSACVIEEFDRYQNGEPMTHEVTRTQMALMA